MISDSHFDPDNPTNKPKNANYQKQLSTSDLSKLYQAIIQNDFFNIPAGENLLRLSAKPSPDPHYYSLSIKMDDQAHTVYWGNRGDDKIREEPEPISNIVSVIMEISSKEKR